MKNRRIEKINHRTGNKVTTNITRSGGVTRITRDLKKADGIMKTRLGGSEIRLTDKTIRRY